MFILFCKAFSSLSVLKNVVSGYTFNLNPLSVQNTGYTIINIFKIFNDNKEHACLKIFMQTTILVTLTIDVQTVLQTNLF